MAGSPFYPGTPRWVKVTGIVVGILVLLAVILMLVTGGRHGPGRHILSGDAGGDTPPARVSEDGVQQP